MEIFLVNSATEEHSILESRLREARILNPARAFASGEECLAALKLQQAMNPSNASLVLLDLSTSPEDGLTLLRQVRECLLNVKALFIMISTLSDLKFISRGYQLGAKTFLIKPVKIEDLIATFKAMHSHLHLDLSSAGSFLRWGPKKLSYAHSRA